ncbi:hypothetical protein EDB92DRAFT_1598121 [Lactarius akahatsu]|uniref:Uncharacterized protein n=1 Tax=Lactarius akahatsu TaxID=416441 RepID=A0AAD4QG30_9AGAM|nr:hypothetical protein EDB92DRAFT_1598121 [Lactarius akahatsu]
MGSCVRSGEETVVQVQKSELSTSSHSTPRTAPRTMSTHASLENRNSFPRLPSRPGRILLGGAAVIGGTFAGAWYYMSAKQAYKASREPGEQGSLPSWEYRLSQAVDPVRGSGSGTNTGAGTVEPRTSPPAAPNRDPNRSRQHRTLASGDALYSENGAKMQPVPQRDRGDGLAYTKKVCSALSPLILSLRSCCVR